MFFFTLILIIAIGSSSGLQPTLQLIYRKNERADHTRSAHFFVLVAIVLEILEGVAQDQNYEPGQDEPKGVGRESGNEPEISNQSKRAKDHGDPKCDVFRSTKFHYFLLLLT
jgi:hypothetical protein